MTRLRVALACALAALAALVFGAPVAVGWVVRTRAVPRLEARLGRRVTVGSVRLGLGYVSLRDLVVDGAGAAPPLQAPLVQVRLGGGLAVEEVVVVHPRIEIVRGAAGEDNVTTLIEKLRAPSAAGGGGGGGAKVKRVRIVSGEAVLSEEGIGEAMVGRLEAEIVPNGTGRAELHEAELRIHGGPRASARKLVIGFALKNRKLDGIPTVEVEGGSATPFRGLALTDIAGAVRADPEDATRAVLEIRGSYGGAGRELWNASGWLRPSAEEGVLKLRADRFQLSQLDSVWKKAGTTRVMNAGEAEVDAHLDVTYHAGAVGFQGAFHLKGLTVGHPMLGPLPVPNFGFDAKARGSLDLHARKLTLTEATVDYRNVHATLTATVENVGRRPKFSARLQVKPLPCQTALAALPVELTPMLQGFKLSGTFSTDLHMGLDFSDLEVPPDLGGQVGIEGCKVMEAPDAVNHERLLATFEQTVEIEPGQWMTFLAGPENPDWVPYNDLSPHLINSIMTTEDSGFFKHHGFISSEFRSALQANLKRGYFRLGASSITMQMIKNVLLSREKTLSRKLQEMFLTWYVERHVTKERILEIYFNVIEFGPGIYGIGRATHHYFGKPPRDLQPQEAAFFSSILPSPKRRYVQFCHADGKADPKWENYIRRILRRMHERSRLTDEEYEKAIKTPLQFDRAEAMPEKECLAFVKRLTTPTMPVMEVAPSAAKR